MLVIIATTTSYGQNFGIKGGLNYANLIVNNSSIEYGDYIFGFHAGVFSTIEITHKLSLRPEALYSKKGYDRKLSTVYQTLEINNRFHYLNLPLLMAFTPLDKLSLLAGPEFGYIIAARQENNRTGSSDDIDDMYDRFDFGLAAGVMVWMTENLHAELRYTHGLSDLTKEFGIGSSRLQNRTFQLSVGYLLK